MEVTEQHFFDLSLNYNLRNPKSKRPTIVYAVFRVAGKQYKINIGAKVYPSQWDNRLKMPIIHNISNLDADNNRIVLAQINRFKLAWDRAKSYICQNPQQMEYPKRCLEIIKENLSVKSNSMEKRDSKVQWLMKYIEKNKQGNTLIKELQNIDLLKRFFKDNSQYQDDFAYIGFEMINAAFRYMEQMTMPNGKRYAISTIREAQKKIKGALKVASSREYRKFDWQASEIGEVQITKNSIPKSERGRKNAPLTSDEIMRLQAYKCNKRCEVVRDLFLIQCYTGQRKSDLMKLLNSDNINWHTSIITIKQTKTKQVAYIPLKDEQLVRLVRKYEGQLQELPVKYNESLKRVAKNAGLTRVVEYTEQRGTILEEHKGHIYELIHNHISRHTFISRMAEAGAEKESVKAITGHTCDATVDDIYTHIDRLKAAQKGAELQKGLYNSDRLIDEASCSKSEPVSNYGIGVDMMDKLVDLKIQCRDLQRENLELSSIVHRQEYEEALEELSMCPPTEEDFLIRTI